MAVTDATTGLQTSKFTKRLASEPAANDPNALVMEIARRRDRLVAPLFIGFMGIYLATLVALAYFPEVVTHKLYGVVNLAYALAIAQFVITFLVAVAYSGGASRHIDPVVKRAFAALNAGGIR